MPEQTAPPPGTRDVEADYEAYLMPVWKDEFIHWCSHVHHSEPVASLAATLADITRRDL